MVPVIICNTKLELFHELLGLDINTLDNGIFQFFQTELILNVLKTTGIEYCNILTTPAMVEEPLGIYEIGS